MKKKNTLLGIILGTCVLVPGIIMFSGCGNDKPADHEHTYSTEWSANDTSHWHDATCEHDDQKTDLADHSYGGWSVTTDPTCTTDGEKERECTVCHHKDTDTIPAGHNYGTWIAEVPATCTTAGTKGHYHCAGCNKDFDAEYNELASLSINALGHTYDVTGKCTHTGCTKDASTTITLETSDKDNTFAPVGDKIYFNFTTIKGDTFYIDTETQQKLAFETEINDETPRLIKSVELYNEDGTLEFELTADSGYDNGATYQYLFWQSSEVMSDNTKYYCVVTLDKEYDEFIAYVSAVEKYYDYLTFDSLTASKVYDGQPFSVTATSSKGLDVIVKYSSDGGTTWTDDAPTNVGTYKVKAYTEDTATIEGNKIETTIKITPKDIKVGNIHVTYNGTKNYQGIKLGANSGITISADYDTIEIDVALVAPGAAKPAPDQYTIYNGGDWCVVVTKENANYNVLLDSENDFNFYIDKIQIAVDLTVLIPYNNTSDETKTVAISSDICEGLVDGVSISGAKVRIEVPSEYSSKGVYEEGDGSTDLTDAGITFELIDSDYYELAEDLSEYSSSILSVVIYESDITTSLLSNSGYVANYNTTGVKEYALFTITTEGLYRLTDDDWVTASILGKTAITSDYYYLQAGTYVLEIFVNSSEDNQFVKLEQITTPNISELFEENSYSDANWQNGITYYYILDITDSAVYQISTDGGDATVSILGQTPLCYGDYKLSAGRYIIKLEVENAYDGGLQIDFYKSVLKTATVGNSAVATTTTDYEEIYFEISLTAGVEYAFGDDSQINKIQDAAFIYKQYGSSVLHLEGSSFEVEETGIYYICLYTTTAGNYCLEIIEA